MYNYVFLIGRTTKDIVIKETKDGKKVCNVTLAVRRSFKNQDGEYDTDFIRVTIWENLANVIDGSVKKGELIGIKGRLCTKKFVLASEAVALASEVVAERIVFLNNTREEDLEEYVK